MTKKRSPITVKGHRIENHWINEVPKAGQPHRVARYLLSVTGGDHD